MAGSTNERRAEAAIRSARMRSNAAIDRHDSEGAIAEMCADARILASSGGLVPDAAAMREAFERVFADPAFIRFVRTTDHVDINLRESVAAEHGRWTAHWRPAEKNRECGGSYLARWRLADGRWRIQSELFIPLARRDDEAAEPARRFDGS